VHYADSSPSVNLNHFRLLRVVGRGAFGKVRIVERKDTNLSFALKYIRKDEGKLLFLFFGCIAGSGAMVLNRVLLPSSTAIVDQMGRAIILLVAPS
jgi:serine/threonine kinase 32